MEDKDLKVEFYEADDDSERIEMKFIVKRMETTISFENLSDLNEFIIKLMGISLSLNEEQFRKEVFEKLIKSKLFKV